VGWWQDAGAVVWATGMCDDDCCCEVPDYGPHREMRRSQEGHRAEPAHEVLVMGGSSYLLTNCECGWRDFSFNYREHLNEVSPLVEVFS
jgi:hypothetical protein